MAKCKACGQSGMFMKVTPTGLCLSCAAGKIQELERLATPEIRKLADINTEIKNRETTLASINESIDKQKVELNKVKELIKEANKRLTVVDEEVELESFALYKPQFDFCRSEEYKAELEKIRDREKQMIKNKSAAICCTDWTVQGSRSEGKKFANEMIKLFIRSFNNECDNTIKEAKFSNYYKCEERIKKSFVAINALGNVNTIRITSEYRDLKLKELAIAHEYHIKKEEEKEALIEFRAQQREEAKLAKEIAEARKEAEKERKHYLLALEKLRIQAENAKTAEEKQAIIEKQNDIISHLDELLLKMEDIDYRQSNQRAGYVYIISNIGSFGEGVYKIGMTRRLDPNERVYELGDASVPFRFDVHAMIFSDDAPKLEAALHQAFADKRVNMVNTRREYFRVSLDEIKRVVRENHDKTVEFIDLPYAQQYRESLMMKK